MRLPNHLGDFLRSIRGTGAQSDDQYASIARLLGFEWVSASRSSVSPEPVTSKIPVPRQADPEPTLPTQSAMDASDAWLNLLSNAPAANVPQWYIDAGTLPYSDETEVDQHSEIEPLYPAHWLRSLTRDLLLQNTSSQIVDVEQLINRLASRQPLTELPRKRMPSLQFGAQIIVDLHPAMRPFHDDQVRTIVEIRRLMNNDQIEVVHVDGFPLSAIDSLTGEQYPIPRPRHGWSVLILSDLGSGPIQSDPSTRRQDGWLAFAARRQQCGHSVTTLFPGSLRRLPDRVRRQMNVVSWDQSAANHSFGRPLELPPEWGQPIVDRRLSRATRMMPEAVKLARYLCLAGRIPRALLRQARLEFLPDTDAGLEAELWFSPLVQTRSPDSILFYPETARELQQQLRSSGELTRVRDFLVRRHGAIPPLARLQEELAWLSLQSDESSKSQFDATIASIIKSIVEQGRTGLGQWAISALARLEANQRSDRAKLLDAVARERVFGELLSTSQALRESVRAIIAANAENVSIGLFAKEGRLRFSEPPEVGSDILKISSHSVRRVFVNDREVTWQANGPFPQVELPEKTSVQIRTEDGAQYEFLPVVELVADVASRFGRLLGHLTSSDGRIVGSAFVIDGTSVVTTRRALNAAARANDQSVSIRLSDLETVSAQLREHKQIQKLDEIAADELIVLKLNVPKQDVSTLSFGETREGAVLYALSCSSEGRPRWSRFQVIKPEGLALRLQPLGMLRWLEQQSWSGALLIDSETMQPVGLAVAGSGGLGIEKPVSVSDVDERKPERVVRRPRAVMSYEVEQAGAVVKRELPFVVGVIGDFAGQRSDTPSLRSRKFVMVDRDNFDEIMRQAQPTIRMRVANRLVGNDEEMAVELRFERFEDFEPGRIAQQIPALKTLLTHREALRDGLIRIDVSESFEQLLMDCLVDDPDSEGMLMTSSRLSAGSGFDNRPSEPRIRVNQQRLMTLLSSQFSDRYGTERAEQLVAALALVSFNPPSGKTQFEPYKSIKNTIHHIDELLSAQMSAVIQHPVFQRIEAAWRGLRYLVHNSETSQSLHIFLLNVSKKELSRNLEMAGEFDQSILFRLLNEEFELPGGQPFGAIVADYSFDHSPQDVALLRNLSSIGAAMSCPFIAAASPQLMGMESFGELGRPRDLGKIFDSVEYIPWRSLRESTDSKFLVLTLPRILARLPYGPTTRPIEEFDFQELLGETADTRHFCWMNAAFAFAYCLIRAFERDGLPLAIRGVENGGRVTDLPTFVFRSEDGDLDMKCPTEVQISDRREHELSSLGLLPLCHYKNTDYAVFFGANSLHRSLRYHEPEATSDAAISSRLPCIMVTSRFVHYIRKMLAERRGSFMETSDIEDYVQCWLSNYVAADHSPSQELRTKYPLKEASVSVSSRSGYPGRFSVTVNLLPYLIMEELSASVSIESYC